MLETQQEDETNASDETPVLLRWGTSNAAGGPDECGTQTSGAGGATDGETEDSAELGAAGEPGVESVPSPKSPPSESVEGDCPFPCVTALSCNPHERHLFAYAGLFSPLLKAKFTISLGWMGMGRVRGCVGRTMLTAGPPSSALCMQSVSTSTSLNEKEVRTLEGFISHALSAWRWLSCYFRSEMPKVIQGSSSPAFPPSRSVCSPSESENRVLFTVCVTTTMAAC